MKGSTVLQVKIFTYMAIVVSLIIKPAVNLSGRCL